MTCGPPTSRLIALPLGNNKEFKFTLQYYVYMGGEGVGELANIKVNKYITLFKTCNSIKGINTQGNSQSIEYLVTGRKKLYLTVVV